MRHHSLLGHLALKFSAHPENIATESLYYILNSSPIAKGSFIRYLAQACVSLPDDLIFDEWVSGADNAIPDLVGVDANRQPRVIIEAKFWAGLTDNQPVTYFHRLPAQIDSMLLFIAPAMRFSTLWNELLRRCSHAGLAMNQPHSVGKDFLAVQLGHHGLLSLVSWQSTLAVIRYALEAATQTASLSDVWQLQGLCAKMDTEAFLPLRSEELTADIGARVIQFGELVEEVTKAAVVEGFASDLGSRPMSSFGYYGRSLKLRDHAMHGIFFSAYEWHALGSIPFWLVLGKVSEISNEIRSALSQLEFTVPPRLLLDSNNRLTIPLYLPLGSEKDQVVKSLVDQLREVARLLP
jgi:hypothetical protein